MPTLDERLVTTYEARDTAERQFRETLREAREAGYSWSQLAAATGMSMHGVRYLTLNLNERRKPLPKEKETNGSKRKARK